ncbi:hypothetical protein [Embleya sp. NPDC059237]|uniref:hypothetical protein n=1 Tax=Embleya sp. NPDC059237 TaxID=3346784 RepID=UPI0036B73FBF
MTHPEERPLDPVDSLDPFDALDPFDSLDPFAPEGVDAPSEPRGGARTPVSQADPGPADGAWSDEEFGPAESAATVIVTPDETGRHHFGAGSPPAAPHRPRQAREGPIWAEESDLVRRTFVPPKGYLRAQGMMSRQLILLTGEARSGKRTLALHLMQDQHVESVIALDPEEDLTTRRIQRGRGYVVDSIGADALAGYTRDDLELLRRRLVERGSVLVATAVVGAPMLGVWAPWHVPCARPDPVQVLHSHLTDRLGPGWERRHLDLVDEDIAELVRADGGRPARAARIAAELAGFADGRFTRTQVLNALRDCEHAAVAGWLRAHPACADWALMIAAAVFEGHDYGIVAERAAALRAMLAEHLPTAAAASADGWPPQSRSARLDLIDATAVAADATRDGARYRLDVVRFNRPRWAASVREHVWDVYPDLRDPLVEWLAATPRQPADVHRVAARAAGAFMAGGRGHRPLAPIHRWARTGARRTMAVSALKAAAQDAVVATQVRHLVEAWSRDTTHPGLRLMAARAYPGLASVYPGPTLTGLLRLARTGDRAVAEAARDGIAALCREGIRAESVLERVEDWEEAAAAAELAAHLVLDEGAGGSPADDRFLAVVRNAVTDRDGYAVVARLFTRLLGAGAGDPTRASVLREGLTRLFGPGRDHGLERLAFDLTRLAYEGLPNGEVIDIGVLEPAIRAFEEPILGPNGGTRA